MHPMFLRVCALLPLMVALASGCGHGGPGNPGPDPHPECVIDDDCSAISSVCEAALCVNGRCVTAPTPSGTACDDGLFCTEGEVCDGRGACGSGHTPCRELLPGIPRCNEAALECEVCSDGRPRVNGECRCPFWNCVSRGGATYCAATDVSEENQTSCYYDGLTVEDLPPLLAPRAE